MSAFRWNAAVISTVLVMAAATAASCYRINFYGVFGNVHGRKFVVYDNERTTKFLFSYNYIPTNFDGLLVGSSISDNWKISRIKNVALYNASLDGGTITEEAMIVNNVLERSHPKVVIVLIYPQLTEQYGRRSGFMDRQEYWGALGSVQLFRALARKWYIDHGRQKLMFDEFGCTSFSEKIVPPALKPVGQFGVNPGALREYADLIANIRSHGATVVGVIPPTPERNWTLNHLAFEAYYAKVKPLFRSGEAIIDFNAPEFAYLRSPGYFIDGIHLTQRAADEVVRVINEELP